MGFLSLLRLRVLILKLLRESGKLQYAGTSQKLQNHYTFKELLDTLYAKEWVVYTKEAFNGANSVNKYLGRYTHRIAITNRRIISMKSETVTYLAKDYKNGGEMIPYTVKGTGFCIKKISANVKHVVENAHHLDSVVPIPLRGSKYN